MSFRLSSKRYSANEQRLFAQLGRKPKSSTDLLTEFYGHRKIPFNGRVRMMNIMRSLERKVAYNGEKFSIVHSPRAGPNPVEFKIVNGK